jgi:IS1 family transposase
VVWERTQPAIQEMVDHAPKAKQYFSDAVDAYDRLWYHWGRFEISEGKTDTYSVVGDNAELRHYLARLARSSRCFSRCPYALVCALRLFVYCYTDANSISSFTRLIQLTLGISLIHYFSHSKNN